MVTEAGRLFSFGANARGQLGLGHEYAAHLPTQVVIGGCVKYVCAGFYHAAAITGEGRLYTWGYGAEGQLGLSNTSSVSVPTEVASAAQTVKQLACGGYCTLMVDEEGAIRRAGKLRASSGGPSSTTFHLIHGFETPRFAQVSCTSQSVLAITTDGALFSMGANGSGQLGNGNVNDNDALRQVQVLETVPIVSAAAGSEISLALSCIGEVWGWGGYGGLGDERLLLPSVVEGTGEGGPTLQLAAGPSGQGWGSNVACTQSDGSLFIWGPFADSSSPTRVAWFEEELEEAKNAQKKGKAKEKEKTTKEDEDEESESDDASSYFGNARFT